MDQLLLDLLDRPARRHQGHRLEGGLRWGVEPISAVLSEHGLKIAPSTYIEHLDKLQTPREIRDQALTGRSAAC